MNSNLRIALIGSTGRLGKAIAALSDPSFRIFASFSRTNLADPNAEADVFIDVSTASALEYNLKVALLAKKPIVVGTTGHSDLHLLEEASQSIPVFYSANFSLGMALMRRAAVAFARKFHSSASIELIEAHHAGKKDAPSGSALMLARAVEDSHPSKVSIQSIRSGEITGEHTLHFSSPEETLTLAHMALSCDAFARGACIAARFLANKPPGFFGMEELLEE